MKKIALAGPSITNLEEEYVLDAVRNGWYETYDMHIKKLEKTFAEFVGAKHAIATYCGTHALHLATIALRLQAGDEVICVDQSYIATAMAISYVGAIPVFVDIDSDTLCIDPQKIEEAITSKTKAIMIVHFAGFAAKMDDVMEIAARYNLAVIEDACQAVGVKYKGKYCGTIGDVGTFSFQGAKICVGGEGGMFVTNDDVLYERAHHFGTFCRNDNIDYLWSDDLGYNYRISNITAALILAQVERIPELIDVKKRIFNWYEECLADIPYISMLSPKKQPEVDSNFAYVVGYLEDDCPITRDELIKAMIDDNNIYMRPGYPSMSLQLGYERRFPVPNSDRYHKRGLVFPTAMNITKDDIIRVADTLKRVIKGWNNL